ncbi:J domain-containing protein [Trichlorobacter ammonificans]|uniref:J domain-containing protein n=1 Tax=Trichlorobacter ammonificans TaxID=2916410 RepID=A0ABN8HNU3_9BACT|nr:J domain-containing protein [Trichlorobacter ammonificans]CAH2031669.1 protein of unknown function [Trichlorobacter ammonificans]
MTIIIKTEGYEEEAGSGEKGPYFGYCYCNERWGWFWGVWENLTLENAKPPLMFGFVASKALAEDKLNRFAYARFIDCGFVVGETYHSNTFDCNKYAKEYIKFEWLWTFSSEIEKSSCCLRNLNKPIWSRCKAGKSKWYWGAWKSIYNYINGDAPFFYGYESNSHDAIVAAITATGNLKHRGVSPAYAQTYLRKLAAIKRQNLPVSNNNEIHELGFLYTSDFPFHFDVNKKWTKHRIVKQTSRYIYVERRPYQKNREFFNDWYDYNIFILRLNRKDIEREGVAYSKTIHGWFSTLAHRRKYSFYQSRSDQEQFTTGDYTYEAETKSNAAATKAIKFLGLRTPYSMQELKKAFRAKALSLHPDQGGTAPMFVQLKNAYDIALRYLSCQHQR